MTPPGPSARRLVIVTLLGYAVFVVYQSLAEGGTWQCGGAVLSTSARLSRSDLLANVVAYVPLGLLCVLSAAPPEDRGRRRIAVPVVVGAVCVAALSLGLEVLQSCQGGRVSSAYDWAANVAGGVFGLGLGGLLRVGPSIVSGRHRPRTRGGSVRLRVMTIAVAAAWVVSQTMPWVFAVDVGTIRSNVSFLRHWSDVPLDLWHVVRHAGAWGAIACAWRLAARDVRLMRVGVVLTALASVCLQLLLDARAPLSFEELIGMGLALALPLSVVGRVAGHRPGPWALGVFCWALVSVGAYQLRPDPLAASVTQPFSLWPRVGLGGLKGAIDYALLFGWFGLAVVIAAQWADMAGYRRARRLWPALAVATMLALEFVQTRIPGRGPDLSAPLFTLIAVLVATATVQEQRGTEPA